MEKYSVLLVDDEEEVLQVIMKKLAWAQMGFEIAGYARNGIEALELAEELQPDVVMTDIKMPYMDGLTLCKKLKEQYPNIKVIIFSGFDEFEYAKEAIKIEAEEYILKPVDSNELRELFERMKEKLDKENDERRGVEQLRAYYMQSLPALQESFLSSLIEGQIAEDKILGYLKNYQIRLDAPYYVIASLHVSTPSDDEQTLDPMLLALSVRRMVQEQVKEKWRSVIFNHLGDTIVIGQLDQMSDLTSFTDEMDRLCRMAKRVCLAKVTAGIGYLCNEIEQFALSYQGAKNAVSYRVIYGNTRAINIAEIDPQENANTQWEETYLHALIKQIKLGTKESLQKAVSDFLQQMSQANVSIQRYRMILMEYTTAIYRFASDNQLDLTHALDNAEDIYAQALEKENPKDLENWMLHMCEKLQHAVLHERSDSTRSFVVKAEEYVHENYANKDLTVEGICQYLGVSAAYFSTVFKKETGKTFINYLTDYRMEKAVELLLSGDEKTYVIADAVGYTDPNYFSYVFKKQFGVSPSKYKQREKGEA